MESINMQDINNSVYNSEILLSLLNERSATPYAIAKKVGKEQSQLQFRECCDQLKNKKLLIAKRTDSGKGIEYSIDIETLSWLFFDYFKDRAARTAKPEDYKIFKEFFLSRTICFFANSMSKIKSNKKNLELFFELVYLYLQSTYLTKVVGNFQGKHINLSLKKKGKYSHSIINKQIAELENTGIFIEEQQNLMPRIADCFSTLFEQDPYIKKILSILEE